MIRELEKTVEGSVALDAPLERRVLAAAIGRLSDAETNIEVQSLAVRCLSVLTPRVSELGIKSLTDSLADAFAGGRADLRDQYAIALKTLVEKAPKAHSRCVADALVARMLALAEGAAPAAKAAGGGAGGGAGAPQQQQQHGAPPQALKPCCNRATSSARFWGACKQSGAAFVSR